MSSATGESILADLLAQLNSFVCFLRIDLSPVISLGPAAGGSQRALERIAMGQNTTCWIERLQDIHTWTNLALWEQDWICRTGGNKPSPCLGSHRLGTMAAFIRQEGLPDNHNTKKALQHGRRVMRFEALFGTGITLLFIPVLPAFRRLSLAEEARTVELLQGNEFTNVRMWAQFLAQLRLDYQFNHGIYPSKVICSISFYIL